MSARLSNPTAAAAAAADPLAELLQAQRSDDPQPAANLAELIAQQSKGGAADVFNPDIHETDGNGAPIKNLDGTHRMKRGRGSPRHREKLRQQQGGAGSAELPPDLAAAAGSGVAGDVGDQAEAPPPAAPYGPAEAQRDAMLAVGTITGGLQGFLGPKWKPEAEEFGAMRDELAAYCLAHGGLGIPPWLGVAMAFGMYAGRRVELPGGLAGKIRGQLGAEADQAAAEEIPREYPPIENPPTVSPVAARPRPVTPGTAPGASARPPMRTAAA
jgi:hypothetical protein